DGNGHTVVSSVNVVVNSTAAAPSITTQPASQTVAAGQSATFTVVALGTAPLSYQWLKNGTAIAGATGPSYTTPPAMAADNGAAFTVVVSNAAGSATSNAATLTLKDAPPPPPVITSALAASGMVGVAFSYAVTATNSPTSFGASGLPAGLSV